MEDQSDLVNPALTNKSGERQTIIPDFVVDTLARCLLSKLQNYFDSPEGQAEFERWKQQQKNT